MSVGMGRSRSNRTACTEHLDEVRTVAEPPLFVHKGLQDGVLSPGGHRKNHYGVRVDYPSRTKSRSPSTIWFER